MSLSALLSQMDLQILGCCSRAFPKKSIFRPADQEGSVLCTSNILKTQSLPKKPCATRRLTAEGSGSTIQSPKEHTHPLPGSTWADPHSKLKHLI